MTSVTRQMFHGEFSSADASALSEAAGRFALYLAGQTQVYPLQPTDQVVITTYDISSVAAVTIQLSDGTDYPTISAGELIAAFVAAATSNKVGSLSSGRFLQPGTYPHLKASGAGQVYATIQGYILQQVSP